MSNEVFMTSSEVCRYCAFSRTVLNRLEKQKLLVPARCLPTSRKRLYLRSDVAVYMEGLKSHS